MTTTTVKLVSCKRCGASDLAWVQSKKTGRYYLALTQKYHGMALGGDRGYSSGGISVLAHRPHKCDDPRAGGHPVCDECGQRHSPYFGSTICKANLRAQAAANPQWDSWTPARWPEKTRYSLDAGDFAAEIEHDTETGEVLLSVWYNGQTVTDGNGVTYREAQMPRVEDAKAKVLEIISV